MDAEQRSKLCLYTKTTNQIVMAGDALMKGDDTYRLLSWEPNHNGTEATIKVVKVGSPGDRNGCAPAFGPDASQTMSAADFGLVVKPQA